MEENAFIMEAIAGVVFLVVGVYLNAGEWSGALGIVNGVLEIVPIAIMWLVFFPPAAYRRWIGRATLA